MDAPRQREGEADGRGLTVWTHFSVPPPPLSFRLQSPSLSPRGVAAAAAAVDTWATPQGSSDPFILAFDGEYCFSKPIPAAGRRADDGIASQSVRQAGRSRECSSAGDGRRRSRPVPLSLAVAAAVFRTFRWRERERRRSQNQPEREGDSLIGQ